MGMTRFFYVAICFVVCSMMQLNVCRQGLYAQAEAQKKVEVGDFSPDSLDKTFEWISNRAADLYEKKAEARAAQQVNELNDEQWKEFERQWKEFFEELNKLEGKKVQWKATVKTINTDGIRLEYFRQSRLPRNGQENFDPHFEVTVQFVEGEASRIVQRDGVISSHPKNDNFLNPPQWYVPCVLFHNTVFHYGSAITKDYAKTLKPGDTLTISGVFSSAHPGGSDLDHSLMFYLCVGRAKVIEPGSLPTVRFDGDASDAQMVHIGRLTELQELNLSQSSVSDVGLAHLKGLTKLTHLGLGWTQVTDAGLVHLKGLTNLSELVLIETQVTDAGLAHLEQLTNLSTVRLSRTRVTDAGLAHLKGLTNLSELDLYWTQVSDAGLAHLEGLTKLADLRLSSTKVTGAGLAHLEGLTNLSKLDLSSTQVTDAGLAHLKGLTKLTHLGLGSTQVTDAGLAHLKGLTNLAGIGLTSTRVSDSGLMHLKGLKKLSVLDVRGTQVTDAGVNELKQALPSAKIFH